MKIILLGAPGAGKGTQAKAISEALLIPTISTGKYLREAMESGSEIGEKVRPFMDAGQLVPDEILIPMIEKRISEDDCKNGFILDGFPRTIPQAEALETMGIDIDFVLEIYVPDEVITQRLSGRRVCHTCGATYHTEYNPPEVENICDVCGNTLSQREDDRPETVKERLKIYHIQTEPLKDFYQKRDMLSVVHGKEKLEDTTKLTLSILGVKE